MSKTLNVAGVAFITGLGVFVAGIFLLLFAELIGQEAPESVSNGFEFVKNLGWGLTIIGGFIMPSGPLLIIGLSQEAFGGLNY